jgi:hypothetical protein
MRIPPELLQRPARIEELQFLGDELIAVVLPGEGVAVPTRVVCAALLDLVRGQRYQKASGTERNMFELLGAQFKINMGVPCYDALPAMQEQLL